MSKAESIFNQPQFNDNKVNKINNFTGEDLTADTYFFKAGQILEYHQHPEGDQIFFIMRGTGKFYLDNGSVSEIDITDGSLVYVPKGVWHKLVADTELYACQATKAGAGMKNRS